MARPLRVCGGNHHHHLTCTQCHRVVEIDVCLPVEQLTAISNQTNFDIEGHSLTIFGRCEYWPVNAQEISSLPHKRCSSSFIHLKTD